MKLFYDDEFDAITVCIGNSGKKFKDVASHIFPDLKPESAYAKLKVCCSCTGDQRLTFGQTIRLMNFCGAFDPLHYACDETMHSRPARTSPIDEENKIVEVIASTTDVLSQALKQLDAVRERRLQLVK